MHIFDSLTNNYTQKISFKPDECIAIVNVAVGRSDKSIRLFVTCQDIAKKTILKMFDRNMNGELSTIVPKR